MITEELTQNLEGMDKDSLLNSMLTKLAGYVSAPAAPAAPPAAPPHGACGACGASCGEGRLPQRVPPKTAAVETPAAYVRRQQDAARLRKEARAADIATRREDGEPDYAAMIPEERTKAAWALTIGED